MQSFNARQTEGLTLVFDGRQLAAAALFASGDTAQPILNAVAIVFDVKGNLDHAGRLTPVGFVATDSYQLGLVGSSNMSPSQLRNTLADDAMSYVLIEKADITKLKVGKVPTLVTLTVGPFGAGAFPTSNQVTLAAHSCKHLPPYGTLVECTPDRLLQYQDQVSIGRIVEGDHPNWGPLVPTQEPTLAACNHLAFNPELLARFASFNKCFGKAEDFPLVMLGAETDQKPAVFTIRAAGACLVALQMPIRHSVEW